MSSIFISCLCFTVNQSTAFGVFSGITLSIYYYCCFCVEKLITSFNSCPFLEKVALLMTVFITLLLPKYWWLCIGIEFKYRTRKVGTFRPEIEIKCKFDHLRDVSLEKASGTWLNISNHSNWDFSYLKGLLCLNNNTSFSVQLVKFSIIGQLHLHPFIHFVLHLKLYQLHSRMVMAKVFLAVISCIFGSINHSALSNMSFTL